MRSSLSTALLSLALAACSSTSSTPNDAASTGDVPSAGDSASAPADAPREAPLDAKAGLVATGVACININLSCDNPSYPDCFEYSSADDAKVREVTDYCASVQGTLTRGPCPATGKNAGCAHQERTPCENDWYYGAFTADFVAGFVCGSTLLLP